MRYSVCRYRVIGILPWLTIFLFACQPNFISAEPSSTSTPVPKPDVNLTLTSATERLAYIGADGNIYITSANLETKFALTTDATAPREGAGLSYQRISWSPEGHLAYAAVTRQRDEAASILYVKDSLEAPTRNRWGER